MSVCKCVGLLKDVLALLVRLYDTQYFRPQVVNLVKELVSKSLVIEELPSAILKKDTKFAATLRLLVGGHFGIKMNLPEVEDGPYFAVPVYLVTNYRH